jgi:hypothetical protein
VLSSCSLGTETCSFCGKVFEDYCGDCLGYLDHAHERIWYCKDCKNRKLFVKIYRYVCEKLKEKQDELLKSNKHEKLGKLIHLAIGQHDVYLDMYSYKGFYEKYNDTMDKCDRSKFVYFRIDSISYLFSLRKQVKITTDQLLEKGLEEPKDSVSIEDIINLDILRGLELLKDEQLGIVAHVIFGKRYHDCFGCDSSGLERFKYYGQKISYIPKKEIWAIDNGKIFLEFESLKGNITPNFEIICNVWNSSKDSIHHKELSISTTVTKRQFFDYQGGYAFDANGRALLVKEVIIYSTL